MSTFNFTVRAMDDQYAYSDREFSINVKSDLIVRAVACDASNAYTTTRVGVTSWITRPGPGGSPVANGDNPVTYGNGIWIISNASKYFTSQDGINWTAQSYPVLVGANSNTFNVPKSNIIFINGMFYFIIAYSSNYNVAQSTDGVNWTLVCQSPTVSVSTNIYQTIMVSGTTVYVSVGNIVYSCDTTSDNPSWSSNSIKSIGGTAINNISSLNYINGLYIAIDIAKNVFTSNDFITWTSRTVANLAQNGPLNYINGALVALVTVGSTMISFSSSDGISWTQISGTLGNSKSARTVGYADGNLLFLGNSSYSTPDGTNWTPTNSGSSYWFPSSTTGFTGIQ